MLAARSLAVGVLCTLVPSEAAQNKKLTQAALQAPALSPAALSVLATLNLNGPGLSAPLTPQQQAILLQAIHQVLGPVPGVSNITLLNALVSSPLTSVAEMCGNTLL